MDASTRGNDSGRCRTPRLRRYHASPVPDQWPEGTCQAAARLQEETSISVVRFAFLGTALLVVAVTSSGAAMGATDLELTGMVAPVPEIHAGTSARVTLRFRNLGPDSISTRIAALTSLDVSPTAAVVLSPAFADARCRFDMGPFEPDETPDAFVFGHAAVWLDGLAAGEVVECPLRLVASWQAQGSLRLRFEANGSYAYLDDPILANNVWFQDLWFIPAPRPVPHAGNAAQWLIALLILLTVRRRMMSG